MRTQSTITAVTVAFALLLPPSLFAQVKQNAPNSDWEVSLGGGVAYTPTYEGSDNYSATALPVISIKYKDRYALGIDGLTADVWKNNTTTLGAGLTYSPGRDQNGSTLFGSSNDNELDGMGNIGGAAGAKVFVSHKIQSVTISGSITRFLGDDNDGLIVDAALSQSLKLSKQWSLTPSISATWADSSYMETFFGVDSKQAAQSRFSQYDADAGFKDITARLRAIYTINQRWSVVLSGSVKQLTSDAADSPITADETSYSVASAIAYTF